MDTVQTVVTILSLLVAVLVPVSNLFWSKRYRDAKEAELSAKDAQIETLQLHIEHLRELTPATLRESYIKMKDQLSEYIDILSQELDEERNVIEEKENVIETLRQDSTTKASEIDKLREDRTRLIDRVAFLEKQKQRLEEMQHDLEFGEEIEPGIPEDLRNPMFG
jgi:chromosome segregation ATPase